MACIACKACKVAGYVQEKSFGTTAGYTRPTLRSGVYSQQGVRKMEH